MLNKLLKRHAPWMDKGRWYKLTLVGTSDNYAIDHDKSDPAFSNAVVSYDRLNSLLNIEKCPFMFLDVKCVINVAFPAVITLSYYSIYESSMLESTNFDNLEPLEGKKLTIYIFGR